MAKEMYDDVAQLKVLISPLPASLVGTVQLLDD